MSRKPRGICIVSSSRFDVLTILYSGHYSSLLAQFKTCEVPAKEYVTGKGTSCRRAEGKKGGKDVVSRLG